MPSEKPGKLLNYISYSVRNQITDVTLEFNLSLVKARINYTVQSLVSLLQERYRFPRISTETDVQTDPRTENWCTETKRNKNNLYSIGKRSVQRDILVFKLIQITNNGNLK